jgi:hypothetical protein
MNHAITVGGLLLSLGGLVGFLIAGFGALATFAGGMSDDVSAGEDASRQGCFFLALGLVLMGASIWGLLR